MHTITHAIISYDIAAVLFNDRRERGAVTLAGILPDIDGIGAPIEIIFREKLPVYSLVHHTFGHTIFAALLVSLGVFFWCRRRLRPALLALIVIHLHLLCDFVGAGGPDGSNWGIPYLWPLSRHVIEWAGQWKLNAWPNIALTLLALAWLFHFAWRRGYSLLEFISRRADRAFVEALRSRFGDPESPRSTVKN